MARAIFFCASCVIKLGKIACVAGAKRGGRGGGRKARKRVSLPYPLPFSRFPSPLPLSTPATQARGKTTNFTRSVRQQTFSRFFQLLTQTSQGKSVNTTGRGALVKLPNLKVTRLKRAKIQLRKVAKLWWVQVCVKFRDFEELYFRYLFFNKSLSNEAILLILRRSFNWCRRIFPNLSMSKVEKNREKVYQAEASIHFTSDKKQANKNQRGRVGYGYLVHFVNKANYASSFAMELEELLVNGNIIASCQANISSKQKIRRYKQHKKKLFGSQIFQNTQTAKRFDQICHSCLFLYFLCSFFAF